jgi:hypothetical protein
VLLEAKCRLMLKQLENGRTAADCWLAPSGGFVDGTSGWKTGQGGRTVGETAPLRGMPAEGKARLPGKSPGPAWNFADCGWTAAPAGGEDL